MLKGGFKKGDTIVEVLFGFAIFSLVAVGSLTLMNQGSALAERSLETSLVRQSLNDQAETLRFMHDAYVASYVPGATFNPNPAVKDAAWQWEDMMHTLPPATAATQLGGTMTQCPALPGNAFITNTSTGQFVSHSVMNYKTPSAYAQTNGVYSQGIWIEAIQSPVSSDLYQKNLGYIDFHINACWPSPNDSVPMTLSTIVRLYEPR